MKKVTLKNRFNFKPAFTLAEVLITLAIIGVVASLTIPTLVKNYQKQQYVAQYKKNYNILQNGFKTIMARDGVTKLSDTKLWATFGNSDVTIWKGSANNRNFLNELSKTFSITKTVSQATDYTYLNASNIKIGERSGLVLKDGTIVYYNFFKTPQTSASSIANKMPEKMGEIDIDVNGVKGPNIIGRDYFVLYLYNDGSIHPHSCKFMAKWEGKNSVYWNNSKTTNSHRCSMSETSNGWGCSARIIEEGWKMNY